MVVFCYANMYIVGLLVLRNEHEVSANATYIKLHLRELYSDSPICHDSECDKSCDVCFVTPQAEIALRKVEAPNRDRLTYHPNLPRSEL